MANIERYQMCASCVMDTSDPLIHFNQRGVCSYCTEFREVKSRGWNPSQSGSIALAKMVDTLKVRGKGCEYDAVLGLSGGVDSSFLALRSREWGLRVLAVHVDGGWNSETAVSNIERVVDYCGYELHTHVVDWSEMRQIQLAYLRASVTNQDVPQDHAFFAALYGFATRYRVPVVMSGGNLATEGIAPDWMFDPLDDVNLYAIFRRFGEGRLRSFPTITFWQRYVWYPLVSRLRVVRPLNLMDYRRDSAVAELQSKVGWRDYGRKHGESRFTKFFQNYYLPTRGYDKRRPHLSSLIVSGQLSRGEALAKLEEPLYLPEDLESDSDFICSKLGITRSDLHALVNLPPRDHYEFPTQQRRYRILKFIQKCIAKVAGRDLRVYS